MTESPFVVSNRILSESSNAFDLLRIIAGEPNRLSSSDRDVLRQAADELEAAQLALIKSNMNLIEAQQRAIALQDQIVAQKKPVKWSFASGWINIENRP